jgi:glucose-1-phosphate thymidylyltransferase
MASVKALIVASHLGSDEVTSVAGVSAPYTIRIGNRPLVSFAVAAARDAGIDDIAVVVCRETGRPVQAALAGAGELTWIETSEPVGFADSLLAAAEFLGTSPFLAHGGDAVVLEPLRSLVSRFAGGGADALLLTSAARALCAVDGRPAPSVDVEALAGAQLFGPEALRLAAATVDGAHGHGPGALAARLEEAGGRVETRYVRDSWTYRGTIDGVLEANRMVLDALGGEGVAPGHPDVRIEGRVALHPSACLERTTVRGPAVIGRGAVLRDSFVGPYSSIGEDTMIEGAEIEHSIVLAGATIRHPGRRLEASLVGEGATVARDFALPAALRLRVGERAEVRLA